ncbi:hypothetical protein BJY00DRAFT_310417 [Aspergillus carlsbadensis]|nr:hypothetical protein BJY00DRAFT_310417 [Aspergillus carlsbadensis]
MARPRARLAAQKGDTSPAPKDQGKRPRGMQEGALHQRLAPKPTSPSPTKGLHLEWYGIPILTTVRAQQLSHQSQRVPRLLASVKRPRRSARLSPAENTSNESPVNPIDFWTKEGQWPPEYFKLDMQHLLARKRSTSSLVRKRSNSATSTTSDQKPREEKSAPYRDPRYETLLETKGSFMVKSNLDITSASKRLIRTLTEATQAPDYSIGFRREAFTDDQLTRLSPFLGDFLAGDQSLFMGTYYMYVPFLTCEVKCGAAALDVADRQNAHSMTLAVRAVAELFRAMKCEGEIHRQILAFSISHDHRSVRIYGHYPVMDGKKTEYYRHPIHEFSFTALDGKEKWTAYRFTKNLYDTWVRAHFKNICSAIDQLPANVDFDVLSVSETGVSQDLESYHLSQLGADAVSLPVEQGGRSGDAGLEKGTPGTSFTDPETAKRRKGRK